MRTAGIIAEFNPFHNGHAYLMQKLRNMGVTHIAVAMSGHVTQRGEFALFDKWTRAKAALSCGADLVLELPPGAVLSSAEGFARGGVGLFHAMGVIDLLGFGSESGELSALKRLAGCMSAPAFQEPFLSLIRQGLPYHTALQEAAAAVTDGKTAAVLQGPNNILAVEYLRALEHIGSSMEPATVKRFGAAHDGAPEAPGFASASFLRTCYQQGQRPDPFLPFAAASCFRQAAAAGAGPVFRDRLERPLLALLRSKGREAFAALPGCTEGLENRLWRAVQDACTYDGLLALASTKRYPQSRLRRLLLAAALGLKTARPPRYIRVLGHNERGREILKAARGSLLPLVQRTSQAVRADRQAFETDCRITALFSLGMPRPRPVCWEMTQNIVRMP